jgi:thiol-disulfide isomerase/thioredoxin
VANANTETLDDERIRELRDDPEARFEFLVDRGVIVERDDGTVDATSAFEDERAVYVDSYKDSSDEKFRETVASLFGLTPARAEKRIRDLELTRWELATYLSLRAALDVDLPTEVELQLAEMVAAVGEASPVPPSLPDLDDDEYRSYLDAHGHAVLFVFQQGCDPCDAMKAELGDVRESVADDVAFAGLDGDEVPEFRREFEITVAPTTLVFVDGDLAETREGYCAADDLIALLEDTVSSADH